MGDVAGLLDVQRLDNTLDQLRYRHENLPERALIVELDAELEKLAGARANTDAQRDELRKRQRALETEAGDVEGKAASLEAKLYDGSVTSPKEATALGEEIAGLKQRQSGFEDQSIELLMEIEPLDEQLVQAEAVAGELQAKRTAHQEALDTAAGELDGEIAEAEQQRAVAASGVPEEHLEHYRKLRITYGPDAIVEFDPSHHRGCPLTMSAVELDRWKRLPADTVDLCADCGRLVLKLS